MTIYQIIKYVTFYLCNSLEKAQATIFEVVLRVRVNLAIRRLDFLIFLGKEQFFCPEKNQLDKCFNLIIRESLFRGYLKLSIPRSMSTKRNKFSLQVIEFFSVDLHHDLTLSERRIYIHFPKILKNRERNTSFLFRVYFTLV
jgi:hypothetical protein